MVVAAPTRMIADDVYVVDHADTGSAGWATPDRHQTVAGVHNGDSPPS